MKIGVPKEIKNNEYRVGLTPNSVRELVKNNHKVFIQKDAGSEIGFSNSEYKEAGALIINTAATVITAGWPKPKKILDESIIKLDLLPPKIISAIKSRHKATIETIS